MTSFWCFNCTFEHILQLFPLFLLLTLNKEILGGLHSVFPRAVIFFFLNTLRRRNELSILIQRLLLKTRKHLDALYLLWKQICCYCLCC